jgi:hypothetical protein
MPRYFSLEEANQALKVIKPLMKQIMKFRQSIMDRRDETHPVMEKAGGNGGNRAASQVALEYGMIGELIQKILSTGVEVKDINLGLVDFLSLRDGREVYLCWQFGEEDIRYWHDLDTGYTGRQPL